MAASGLSGREQKTASNLKRRLPGKDLLKMPKANGSRGKSQDGLTTRGGDEENAAATETLLGQKASVG